MSDQALDLVIDALRQLKDNAASPRASLESLARLGASGTSAPPRVEPGSPAAESPRLAAREPIPAKNNPPRPAIAAPQVHTPLDPGGGSKAAKLAALQGPVLACTRCPHLVKSRTQVVFGVGNPEAELMFVGEAPGADEDLVGEPFVGKAGQLLTKIIEVMAFGRADVYIANILKCRPDMPSGSSGNRKPTTEEMETCKPYLLQQIEIIRPRVIVALGATAVAGLLGVASPISRLRGTWQEFHGTPVMPTFHPSYLLRNQALSERRKVWEDMLLVLERLGRPITDRQRGFFLKGT